jgi:methylated-DNA-[protein]-cysteine S-methyltransferase
MDRWMKLQSPLGELVVTGSEKAVHRLYWPGQYDNDFSLLDRPLMRCHGDGWYELVAADLNDYFAGVTRPWSVLLHPKGTYFQQQVWHELLKIKWGECLSYKAVAVALNKPTASRAVGMANHRNPLPLFIPCHRVVGINGQLTGYAGGIEVKRWLLQHESAR